MNIFVILVLILILVVGLFKYKLIIDYFSKGYYRLSSVFTRFKYIFIAYLSFICFWIIAKLNQAIWTPIIECDYGLGAGFYVSWLASLSEDILFFGIIGLLGLILSTKLPQDEEFNIRIKSLANGKKAGGASRTFLKNEIQDLLIYNDLYTTILTIKSINAENNLIEIHAEITNHINNMCKDVEYPYFANAFVQPGPCVNGSYGYISQLVLYDEQNLSNRNTYCEEDIIKLTEEDFYKETSFNINADGTVIQKFCYNLWCPFNQDINNEDDNWYFLRTFLFTENFEVKIVNNLQEIDISCFYKTKGREYSLEENYMKFVEIPIEEKVLIKKGESEIIISKKQQYKDDFKLYFFNETNM